jgi:prepilin-type N-terminal cleavage/methylation domain-containing protein/prepilin-type processing-associated H-X9-DG protein
MKQERRAVLCRGAGSRGTDAGFSLIELLVVVLILALLSTLMWRKMSGEGERSKAAECQQNLQKLFIALQLYSTDHKEVFPVVAGATHSEQALDPLVPKCTADTTVFICPASKDATLPSGESLLKKRISYAYYMGRRANETETVLVTDEQVSVNSKSPGQQVFSSDGKPPGNNHQNKGGNFLFCDGHADSSASASRISLVLTQGVVLLNPLPR